MEFIFELAAELFFDGAVSLSKNRKVPRVIRLALIALIFLFFAAVVGFMLYMGIRLFKDNLLAGIAVTAVGIVLLLCAVRFLRNLIRVCRM